MLAIEVGSVALADARLSLEDAVAAAALGFLALLALLSPVIVDWLPNLGAHDYAPAYAAYRKPPDVFLRQLGDWVGLIPALAAAGRRGVSLGALDGPAPVAAHAGQRGDRRALFLRIQTPYIHHLYLIAPAIAAPIAASLMSSSRNRPRAALVALAAFRRADAFAACAGAQSAGLAPIAGLPRAPRADLDELERLKDWVDAAGAA